MKIIQSLYRVAITSAGAFTFISLLSIYFVSVILDFKDLSLQTWKVRTAWNELSLINDDILYFQLDSISYLNKLREDWLVKTKNLDQSFQDLYNHPRAKTLSPELTRELIHADYIWRFSKKRIYNAQQILNSLSDRQQLFDVILASGNPSLYENIKVLSLEGDLSFEERLVYRSFLANTAVFFMTRNEFTDILNVINNEIPPLLEQRIFALCGISFILYILTFTGTLFFLGKTSAPIKQLVQTMNDIGQMDYLLVSPKPAIDPHFDEIALIQHGVYEMCQKISSLYEQNLEIEKEKQEARLKALQYQINPHFLYNTLGSIQMAALIEQQPRIGAVIKSLSQLLRKTINMTGHQITVYEELDMLDDYINIMQFRYFDRISVVKEIDPEVYKMYIPSQILQPLLENAIQHGINEYLNQEGKEAFIYIRAYIQSDVLYLEVEDNGTGMDISHRDLSLPVKDNFSRTHLGLSNIDERIKINFGLSYGLTVTSQKEQGTKILITLPILRSTHE
ncbi:sensor histidine kinase [Spirochaeta cellobiosiphila]|uniref:sensor histidine kinase n=1 Tax=Spirochaeta cellobiosiphila TaxID=504483 RepID=UPI000414B78A|nr:histidine kinase [Spirochaeta cellobiosiphila]